MSFFITLFVYIVTGCTFVTTRNCFFFLRTVTLTHHLHMQSVTAVLNQILYMLMCCLSYLRVYEDRREPDSNETVII